jgi:hypothetical protein
LCLLSAGFPSEPTPARVFLLAVDRHLLRVSVFPFAMRPSNFLPVGGSVFPEFFLKFFGVFQAVAAIVFAFPPLFFGESLNHTVPYSSNETDFVRRGEFAAPILCASCR